MKSVLYLSTATSLVLSQSTGLLTLFLPDSQPLSLDASAVAVNTAGPSPVTTLEVACPTAASPDNDACRLAGIYPAQVYHTAGSVWGGTTTYSADDSTTTWVCTLGGNPPISGSADCTKTIVGGSTRTETEAYNACYVGAHQRPIVVTAGAETILSAHYFTIDASELVSARNSVMAEAGCPASQTTMWAGAVARIDDGRLCGHDCLADRDTDGFSSGGDNHHKRRRKATDRHDGCIAGWADNDDGSGGAVTQCRLGNFFGCFRECRRRR
jgi:hypothetical protein